MSLQDANYNLSYVPAEVAEDKRNQIHYNLHKEVKEEIKCKKH